jgi:trimeric autotransporter adhesin
MTNKSTGFKRIALVLVAALGFGVLSAGSSSAVINQTGTVPTLTLSASSGSGSQGETVTVTATVSFIGNAANDSVALVIDDAGTNITENGWGLTTDSANVHASTNTDVTKDNFRVGVASDLTSGISIASSQSGTANTSVTAKITVAFVIAANESAGTKTYTLTLRNPTNAASATNYAFAQFVLTTTAGDTTASAAKTKMYFNQEMVAANWATRSIEADSALVVSSGATTGAAIDPVKYGAIWVDFRNAADTNVAGTNANTVTGSLVLNVSGPGLLSKPDRIGGVGTRAKSVTLTLGETALVWSDGTAGTMTITGYMSGTTALTQAAKTVTFYGPAITLTATETTVVSNNGGAPLSSSAADSLTVGTKILTFTAKDSAGNFVKTAAMNRNGALYCISSDTSIIGVAGSTLAYATATTPAADSNTWSCDMQVRAAGSASITVGDSMTVASSLYTSTAKTFTIASKTGKIGTIAFDKTSYNVGDAAVITVTAKNATAGVPGMVNVLGDAQTGLFTGLVQNRAFSAVKTGFGFGGTDSTSFSLTGSTFVNGVETYVVYMPTTAGKVTFTGFTSDGTNDTATAVSVSVDVVDPLEAVVKTEVATSKAAADAATAAADAATDAALQAIDAANAATDAANLAAEAADAATVAAEEAKDAADAATAAVEALATQVATLMAALQAQVRSLANTVAKIAKKVGA